MSKNLKTGVVGPAGTASHEAATRLGYKDVAFFRTITDVFVALENDEIHVGVVPIENIIRGNVGDTLDGMYDFEPKVIGEAVVPIALCIASKAKKKSDVKVVLSDQRAIAQCLFYLNKKFPDQEVINVASAAHAMRYVAESRMNDCAAIGSEFAAKQYKLNVLDRNIEDRKGNLTRYLVVSKKINAKPAKESKTSIFIFPKAKKDQPGILYYVSGCFAKNNINLTQVSLRPSRKKLGIYYFYFEFAGNEKDANVQKALKELAKYSDFKILGSFPKVY
jgi:prephenate dehydratase